MTAGVSSFCGGLGRFVAIAAIISSAILVSGCASFRGAQDRVTAHDVATYESVCPSQSQIQAGHPGETNGAYRNRIVLLCIQVINSKYGEFTGELSKEASGTNLVSDIVAQTLATGASIVKGANAARKLAAGSALSLGVGAAVNKDLFYKQTLPAIVASMDAKRAKVLTAILQAENSDPQASVYTLDRAGFDLEALQEAGSLNNAVQELTTAAVQNAAEATAAQQEAATENIGTVQPITADIRTRILAAAAEVKALEAANQTDKLRLIATGFGLAPQPSSSAKTLSAIIRRELAKVTTADPAKQDEIMKRYEAILSPYKEAL